MWIIPLIQVPETLLCKSMRCEREEDQQLAFVSNGAQNNRHLVVDRRHGLSLRNNGNHRTVGDLLRDGQVCGADSQGPRNGDILCRQYLVGGFAIEVGRDGLCSYLLNVC
jgi:hypothetical protein